MANLNLKFGNEKLRKAPAVIIVSGSEGRIEKAENIAQLLSSRGSFVLFLFQLTILLKVSIIWKREILLKSEVGQN